MRKTDSNYFYELSQRLRRASDAIERARMDYENPIVSKHTLEEVRRISDELFDAYRDALAEEVRSA